MQANRVQLAYSTHSQTVSGELWDQIKSNLQAQFPLRTLHWKSATRPSIRTIQTLDIELVPFEGNKEESVSQIPLTLLEKPFLNIFVVACEDNETYKATVKKSLKEWHATVTSRKNQEWLIILVTKPDVRPTSSLLKIRGTVLDRVKADFNTDKRDRCSQLALQDDLSNPRTWAEVVSKVKEGVTSAFDSAVLTREEEIKRLEAQRQMPGWNFCNYFILKESLAQSFEGMNLFEDALIQYEELEASFSAVLSDNTSIWFGKFVDPSRKDDSQPLLSITKKPYRDLILANTISVLDFRTYILAREAILMGKMGFPDKILRKTNLFLSVTGGRLRTFQSDLPDFYIESWTYSSALSSIESCQEWQTENADASQLSRSCAARGELLELARLQLDRLGVRLKYLPDNPPFAFSISENELPEAIAEGITNKDLVKCSSDENYFYSLYVKLTNQAIDSYVKCGRRKFALKLHGSLAALDLHREKISTALQVFTSLPVHYKTHQWSSMESYMRLQGLYHLKDSEGDGAKDFVLSAMSFLGTWSSDSRMELLEDVHDPNAFILTLVNKVVETMESLDENILIQDSPIIETRVLHSSVKPLSERDGFIIEMGLLNKLPCALNLSNIVLTLKDPEGSMLKFSTDLCQANPGKSAMRLICSSPSPGNYLIYSVEVHLGKLLMSWQLGFKEPRLSALRGHSTRLRLITLPIDTDVFSVNMRQPDDVSMRERPELLVEISTGRNKIRKASLRLSSNDIVFDLSAGIADDSSLTLTKDTVDLVDVDRQTRQTCLLPYKNRTGKSTVKVIIDIDFTNEDEVELTRSLRLVKVVTVSLPFAVNVRDCFRGQSLFSSFTLSSAGAYDIRVASVTVEACDGAKDSVEISNLSRMPERVETIRPAYPAVFIFQIQRLREVKDSLQVTVKYRSVEEEINCLLEHCSSRIAPHNGTLSEDVSFNSLISESKERPAWLDLYVATGKFDLPNKRKCISSVDVSRILAQLAWHTFKIPVDLPHKDIIAAASIYVAESPFSSQFPESKGKNALFAGQPFTAFLSVNVSCHWSGREEVDNRNYRMRFEVDEMIRDWLISGQKRGEFFAQHGTTHKVAITLMALRHGEIPLPRVNVVLLTCGDEHATDPLTLECYQVCGAKKLMILPRNGKTSFVLNVGPSSFVETNFAES